MDKLCIKQQLDRYLQFAKSHSPYLLIVIVANVEGETTDYDDYENTSVLSEYYTLTEYEAISVSLKKLGYEVVSYFNESDFMDAILHNRLQRKNKNILVINSAQKGTYIGRKSLVPAFCEHFKIMHTGSNPYVVSLCRDKFHTSAILNNYIKNQLPTYAYSYIYNWIGNARPQVGERVIAKLNSESASIGLSKNNIFTFTAQSVDQLNKLSKQYDQTLILQPFISGYEIELPIIIGKEILPLITTGIKINNELELGDNILDYKTHCHHLYDFYNFDDYNHKLASKAKEVASKCVNLLGIEGFGRVDFRIDNNGNCYVSDIATNPHVTEDSSYYFVFNELGYSYSEFLAILVGLTLEKYS